MTDPYVACRSKAMDLLARREHTRKELISKLRAREFGEDLVFQVLDKLRDEGLQSDDRFTEAYISMRMKKGLGPVRIKQELQERGIPSEQIEDFLDSRDPVWRDQIREVRQKKFGSNAPEDYQTSMKQARFLQYRGFTHEHIRRELDELNHF